MHILDSAIFRNVHQKSVPCPRRPRIFKLCVKLCMHIAQNLFSVWSPGQELRINCIVQERLVGGQSILPASRGPREKRSGNSQKDEYFQTLSENHKMSHIYFIHIYYHPTLSEVRKNIFFNPLTLFVKVRVGDDVIFVSVATERWNNQTTNQHQNSSIWPLE